MKTAIGYADITPEESVPLMGYGDRTHSSEGIHDPLLACAWWLEPPGGRPLVWVVPDLCLMSVISSRELIGELALATGLAPEQILVSTTHTHSGPDVSFVSRSREPWAGRYYAKLIAGCSEAIRKTREAGVDGRIEVRLAQSDLGVNRRDAASPMTRGSCSSP